MKLNRKMLLIMSLCGVLAACEKEEKAGPATLPLQLSLEGIHESSLLVGTESVSLKAENGSSITKVEFYLGTQLLGADESSPYELEFATTAFPDGEYALKAVVKESSGTLHEVTKTVQVSNVLMQLPAIQFESSYLSQVYHLIIATEGGAIISKQAISESAPLTISAPQGFYDTNFVYYLLNRYTSRWGEGIYGTASMQVPRGYNLTFMPELSSTPAGTAEVVFHNLVEGQINFKSQYYLSGSSTTGGSKTIALELMEAKQDVLIELTPADGGATRHYLLTGMTPGNSYTVDYNNFVHNPAQVAINLPQNSPRDMFVFLQPREEDRRIFRGPEMKLVSGSTYEYASVASAFRQYVYAFVEYLETSNSDYQKVTTIQEIKPNFVLDPMEVTVNVQQQAHRKIGYTVTTNDAYDVATFFYTGSAYDFELVVNTGKTSGDFTIIDMQEVFPDLPTGGQPAYAAYRLVDLKLGGYANFVQSPYAAMFDRSPREPYRVVVGWKNATTPPGRSGSAKNGSDIMPY